MADLPTTVTNTLYGVDRLAEVYEAEHDGEQVIAAGASKAVHSYDPIPVGRGLHWATARRAALLGTSERLVCGDWDIPYDRIDRAELLHVSTLLSRGLVLRIRTVDGHHYQFGLQADGRWRDLPLPLEEGESALRFSPLGVVLRVLLIGALGFWVVRALLG